MCLSLSILHNVGVMNSPQWLYMAPHALLCRLLSIHMTRLRLGIALGLTLALSLSKHLGIHAITNLLLSNIILELFLKIVCTI
jgi:hypothetical protein